MSTSLKRLDPQIECPMSKSRLLISASVMHAKLSQLALLKLQNGRLLVSGLISFSILNLDDDGEVVAVKVLANAYSGLLIKVSRN